MIKKTMYDMNLNEQGIVEKVNVKTTMKRRLLDLGLTPGTRVEKLFINYGNSLTAYNIRGAVIALREEDSKNIWIRSLNYE